MKKKIVALGLSLMMCVGALAGCGSSSSSSASSEGTADSAVEEQAETGAEAQTEAEGGSSIESIHFGTNAEFPPFEFGFFYRALQGSTYLCTPDPCKITILASKSFAPQKGCLKI